MANTLDNQSGILILKYKFFFFRILTYFGFLLLPVWLQKSLHLNQGLQALVMLFYILFMCSQWFFLGKEIDHRLKIYFRVNSSIDRVVYRLFLGKFFFIIYFNLIGFLPHKWIYNTFWITWVLLGLFYSWPTRGKIIRESVSTNFSEFRYLDRFEKTLVGLIISMFIVSIPELPKLNIVEALKLFFDARDLLSPHLWEFITINYYPFYRYPDLFKLALSMHFYIIGTGMFFLTFYALLRFFVSRRLSLLGVFALLSSWSFTKILAADYGATYQGTYSLLWVWSLLWVTKSSTYRAGLFLGLVGYYGTLINQSWILLSLIQLCLVYFFFLKSSTLWFRRQMIRYALFGVTLNLLIVLTHSNLFSIMDSISLNYFQEWKKIFNRKAFYILSIFGVLIISLKYLFPKQKYLSSFKFDGGRFKQMIIALGVLHIYSLVFDAGLVSNLSIMWVIVIFSLIPLEVIFQTISRLRSSRNMIYLIYIIICLLDSHFEGRVKIFLRLFNS